VEVKIPYTDRWGSLTTSSAKRKKQVTIQETRELRCQRWILKHFE
jgi:hypothetical protein